MYAIQKRYPDSQILATLFSPSGYDNVNLDNDRITLSYVPIDSYWDAKRFLNIVRPDLAIVVRHDIWPNIQWHLHSMGIPSLLIDASISDKARFAYSFFRYYHRTIYATFSRVLAVSQEQAERLSLVVPDRDRILIANDTRYDQVYRRTLEKGKIDHLISSGYFKKEKCVVAGSTWPQDEKHLLPAIAEALARDKKLIFIIAPHEVTPVHVNEIREFFAAQNIPLAASSTLDGAQNWSFRVLLIDQYGILANLYSLGFLAYVGGGFGLGVNSVLEPSAHGCYVMFGPRHLNVPEAKVLLQRDGAVAVHNTKDMLGVIESFLLKPRAIAQKGENAKKMVLENIGASEYIVNIMEKYFIPRPDQAE